MVNLGNVQGNVQLDGTLGVSFTVQMSGNLDVAFNGIPDGITICLAVQDSSGGTASLTFSNVAKDGGADPGTFSGTKYFFVQGFGTSFIELRRRA